jgi:hypothetical protein
MKLRLLALALALAGALPTARAASFLEVVSGSASRTTTASTQGVGSGVGFTVGKLRLTLDAGQRAFITYTFEGAEANQRNQFFGPGGASMIDSSAAVGTLLTTSVGPGLLDFAFQTVGHKATAARDNYGWNDANIGLVLASDRLSGRLMFEDGRGRLGSDFDYDDMVVNFKVSVAPVPEAGGVLLMGAGIGVLALALRRRRRL